MHVARVALFVVLVGLIHWRHERFVASERAAGLASVPLARVREIFPDATQIGAAESHGGRVVLDEKGRSLGYVIETAPDSDAFLGFSGSTNLLIGFDPRDRAVGVAILSSGDTRDHVDLIRRDPKFMTELRGLTADEIAAQPIDAVSGATLSSLAMYEGLRARLGRAEESLKFPAPPTLADARVLFPAAEQLESDRQSPSVWRVLGPSQVELGVIVRTSPAADSIIGYQGPTESWIGVSPAGRVLGVTVGSSFDNEPYVGYVRGDEYFRHVFDGKSLEELSVSDVKVTGIEGVSGATMTSQAVARGVVAAARRETAVRQQRIAEANVRRNVRVRTITTSAIVVAGIAMSVTRLRGAAWFRLPFQATVIGYLGFVNGDLLSSALLVGWARGGVPWQSAAGLVLLSAAALILPVLLGRNTYCAHLCPHGAIQQWLSKLRPMTRRPPPKWLAPMLACVRPLLLGWIVFVGMTDAGFSLADIEPFDAYLWRAATWPTVTVAIAGLVASVFWPMAYCRHGCPAGSVLNYLRRHSRSGAVSRADIVAIACLTLAGLLALVG